MIGVILAVGAGETDERGRFRPTELRAGLVVLFGKFVGTEYEHEGEKILFMRESDVLAVVGTEAEEAESL
jgi:chaperonin GroES